LSNENPWGIMRFLEESKYNNLPRVKRFKTRILIEPSLKMLPLKFACAKCGLTGVFTNGFGILSGKF
jgi:hypothetical protein